MFALLRQRVMRYEGIQGRTRKQVMKLSGQNISSLLSRFNIRLQTALTFDMTRWHGLEGQVEQSRNKRSELRCHKGKGLSAPGKYLIIWPFKKFACTAVHTIQPVKHIIINCTRVKKRASCFRTTHTGDVTKLCKTHGCSKGAWTHCKDWHNAVSYIVIGIGN